MSVDTTQLLDRARTAKEVVVVAALALMKCGGDGRAALRLLKEMHADAPGPESVQELDAIALAYAGISAAMELRDGCAVELVEGEFESWISGMHSIDEDLG